MAIQTPQNDMMVALNKVNTPLTYGWHEATVTNAVKTVGLYDDFSARYVDQVTVTYQFTEEDGTVIELDMPYQIDPLSFTHSDIFYEHAAAILQAKPQDEINLDDLKDKRCKVNVVHRIDDKGEYETIEGVLPLIEKRTPTARIVRPAEVERGQHDNVTTPMDATPDITPSS